ncbi:MAG TPA: DUF3788 family protein [Paludibacteraceae bacterium]|nr:DUF3788 family protein [Paludibacteraceae bacterium]HPT43173.1 DUF3788 family protein [Paludibacteraceae bacterium]
MDTQLLRNKELYPTEEVLQKVLMDSIQAYNQLVTTIAELQAEMIWRYYNDGKSWLCKVQHKNKTIFWLSVWDGYFKTTFYFTEKNCQGIELLDIDQTIRNEFRNNKPIGKFLPLTLTIQNRKQLIDLLKIAEYKRGLK